LDVYFYIVIKPILDELGVKLPTRFKYFRARSSCMINPSSPFMTQNISTPRGF